MKPHVRVFRDLSRLSLAAARLFARQSGQAIAERGRFLAALSGGSTPMALYHLLSAAPLDWAHIHLFWGDERCVPANDPENNFGQVREVLLSKVPIPEGNLHRIHSELPPAKAVEDYSLLLIQFATPAMEWPRFDLVLLGLGKDGHTASLFPGSPVDPPEPVIHVTGEYQDRPADRVTLTPRVFNSGRHVVFLVSGESKSAALASVIKGGLHPDQFPAQRIHPEKGKITWMVDAPAATKL